jgi:hypothetical protein
MHNHSTAIKSETGSGGWSVGTGGVLGKVGDGGRGADASPPADREVCPTDRERLAGGAATLAGDPADKNVGAGGGPESCKLAGKLAGWWGLIMSVAHLPSTRAEPESSQAVMTRMAAMPVWQNVRCQAAEGHQRRTSATPSATRPTSAASSASSWTHPIAKEVEVKGPSFVRR